MASKERPNISWGSLEKYNNDGKLEQREENIKDSSAERKKVWKREKQERDLFKQGIHREKKMREGERRDAELRLRREGIIYDELEKYLASERNPTYTTLKKRILKRMNNELQEIVEGDEYKKVGLEIGELEEEVKDHEEKIKILEGKIKNHEAIIKGIKSRILMPKRRLLVSLGFDKITNFNKIEKGIIERGLKSGRSGGEGKGSSGGRKVRKKGTKKKARYKRIKSKRRTKRRKN